MLRLRLAPALGAVGVLLVLSVDGGLFLAVGITALLAFVALSSVAIVSSSVVEDRQVELAEPLRVGEEVELDDLPVPDGGGGDRERLSVQE